MDNTVTWRHNAEVAKSGLSPLKEGKSLFVPVEFDLFVAIFGVLGTGDIDLNGVIDDQIGLAKRVDLVGVSTKLLHSSAHSGQVNDSGDTSEVLEEYTSGFEGDLNGVLGGGLPVKDSLDIGSYIIDINKIVDRTYS